MNTTYFILLCTLLVLNISVGNSAQILAIFPSPGYSQYILAEPLLIELAERGHNITVISPFETKNVRNLRTIRVDVSDGNKTLSETLYQLQQLSIYGTIMFVNEFALRMSEKILSNEKVQNLIHSNETFDLILIETFYNEALQAFAKHFNAYQVLFHSMVLNDWNSHLVGNPNIPSYMPSSFGGFTTHMTLRERFSNTMALWFGRIYKDFIQHPAHQKLVDQYFPKKYNLDDIIYDASLMLTCSHVSTTEALALTTSVVEVGGLHIKNKQLPDKVKDFLDLAKDGAIFFSLGSNLKSSDLPKKLLREILDVFGKLKQKVLWKFEEDVIENKPDNVMISKWFPQNDILAHPNTILFISHAGMGSTTEAIYHGVPVLGIPVFIDQFMNLRRLLLFGICLELPFNKLGGEILEKSIHEILSNPKYRDNAKRRSNIMKDRPVQPLDLAIYWIEYVLRHEGAHHLKNSILNLTWYQLYLLDIIGVLFVGLFSVSYFMFLGIRFLKHGVKRKNKVE